MKKLFMRKTAGLLALLLTVSMLIPVIAFAAKATFDVTYSKSTGKASGYITVDKEVYDAVYNAGGNLTYSVYSSEDYWKTFTAWFGSYDENKGWKFKVYETDSIFETYRSLTFKYFYNGDPIESTVVRSSGNGGGGIGGTSSTVSGSTVTVGADGKVSAEDLINAFTAGDGQATLNLEGEFVLLPASALLKGKTLTIVSGDVSYTLPLSALKIEELAASLEVSVDDLNIQVDLTKLVDDAAAPINAAVTKIGGKELASVRDFKITAIAGDKTKEINNFGTYVSRAFTLGSTPASSDNVVGVLFDPVTGQLSFVPTTLSSQDGKSIATLKRTSNSIYTVISTDTKSFADLSGHWSKAEVEKLASNLIVNGTSDTTFAPNRTITRAEFAAIVVRALGLTSNGTTDKFSDVSANAWYAGDVAAAANAGIINGYTDGTFKPTANTTRQELASMVVRAMKFAGKDASLTDAQVSSALATFADAKSLTWAKADVAVAVQEGIVKGQSGKSISPLATASRAEAAAMVLRFLTNVNFIN